MLPKGLVPISDTTDDVDSANLTTGVLDGGLYHIWGTNLPSGETFTIYACDPTIDPELLTNAINIGTLTILVQGSAQIQIPPNYAIFATSSAVAPTIASEIHYERIS
jgi:hypothetical protein